MHDDSRRGRVRTGVGGTGPWPEWAHSRTTLSAASHLHRTCVLALLWKVGALSAEPFPFLGIKHCALFRTLSRDVIVDLYRHAASRGEGEGRRRGARQAGCRVTTHKKFTGNRAWGGERETETRSQAQSNSHNDVNNNSNSNSEKHAPSARGGGESRVKRRGTNVSSNNNAKMQGRREQRKAAEATNQRVAARPSPTPLNARVERNARG